MNHSAQIKSPSYIQKLEYGSMALERAETRPRYPISLGRELFFQGTIS